MSHRAHHVRKMPDMEGLKRTTVPVSYGSIMEIFQEEENLWG